MQDFAGLGSFPNHACRELSASGKFEEGYLKVHDVLSLKGYRTPKNVT